MGIYSYELAKHMYKIVTISFLITSYNGFNISATTIIRETRKTSKLTYKIPLAKTLNDNVTYLFEGPQYGMIFQKILK